MCVCARGGVCLLNKKQNAEQTKKKRRADQNKNENHEQTELKKNAEQTKKTFAKNQKNEPTAKKKNAPPQKKEFAKRSGITMVLISNHSIFPAIEPSGLYIYTYCIYILYIYI